MIVEIEEWIRVHRREHRHSATSGHYPFVFAIYFHLSTAQGYLPEYDIDESVLADIAAEITSHGAFVGRFRPAENQREAYIHFTEAR